MKTVTFDETKWKLVPVESTPEMEWSWNRADVTFTDGMGRRLPHDPHSAWKSRYAAMLAATPSQESAAPQGGFGISAHQQLAEEVIVLLGLVEDDLDSLQIQDGQMSVSMKQWNKVARMADLVRATPSQEPFGYINAGHLHEIQSGRAPYGYVYAAPGVGAEVPVYTTPATQLQVTLTDERLREIDDAHNWQTTEGRMDAYKTIIADLKANAIRARSKK